MTSPASVCDVINSNVWVEWNSCYTNIHQILRIETDFRFSYHRTNVDGPISGRESTLVGWCGTPAGKHVCDRFHTLLKEENEKD